MYNSFYVTVTRLIVGNAQEVLMPLITGWIRAREEAKKEQDGAAPGSNSSSKEEGYFGMSDSLTRAEQVGGRRSDLFNLILFM